MTRFGVGHGFQPVQMSGGGPEWTPLFLPGDVLWLRADLDPTTTADTARWLDLSTQVDHLGQDIAAQKPALSGTALEFNNAATENLTGAPIAGLQDGYTLGLALRMRTPASGNQEIVFMNGTAGDAVEVRQTNTSARWLWHRNVGPIIWGNCTANPETWVFRHDGAGGNADFALDGAHQVQQALANTIPPTVSCVLAAHIGPAFGANVDVYGVIGYSDRKTDADVLNMSAYLTALRDGTALPAWRPTDLPNLVARFERPDLYAGPHLSQLDDQGGIFDVAEAVPANRPVLIPFGPNGLPFIHCDGTNDRLVNAAYADTQPTHVFAVAMPSETGVANSYVIDGTGLRLRALHTTATPALAMRAGALVESPGTTDAWHYYSARFRGPTSRMVTDGGTPTTGNAGPGIATGLTVGASGNLAQFGDCRIAELILCSQAQSVAATARVEGYMARRYGL